MKPFGFAPLSKTLPYWPADVFGQPEFLDEIGVRDFEVQEAGAQLAVAGTLIWVREIAFDLPLVKSFSIALLSANGYTEVPFELDILPAFALRLPNISIAFRLESKLLRPVKRVNKKWVAITDGNGKPKPAELSFSGIGVQVELDGNVELLMPSGAPKGSLGAVQIGDTGLVLELDGLAPYFTVKQTPPPGTPAGFRGVTIDSLKVHLPDDFDGPLAPDTLLATNLVLGTGGLSGKIGAQWNATFANGSYTGSGGGTLFGIPFGLKSLDVTFKQNIPTAFSIRGEMLLPFFDHPVKVGIGIGSNGNFMLSLDSGTANGLYKFTKPDLLEMELDSIAFEVKDGVFIAKLSGQITPLFGGLAWPGFKVEELSIDSKGHVKLQGGWLALRKQYELKISGFKLSITKIGFGKTEDGGKWVGFSGGLKLVDGFTAGASVEGLRITWYDDGRDPKFSFEGIGVEFTIPEVLTFKGAVSMRDLDVNGTHVRRFDGDIKLKLIALKLEIDAKLVFGSASGGPEGSYNFFAIYLGVELPTGIPLGSLPLSIYGMAGLFALQMEPNRTAAEEWYEGWYKRNTIGVTDLTNKWMNRRGSLALGAGLTFGTNDNGFTFNCKALLVIVFPGPILMIEGKANLLKERAKLSDDPMFRTLAVLDMREGQVVMGLDARYKQDENSGKVLDIRAGAEAFFHTPNDWHLYLGEREPRDKRIRAEIFKLFEANAYFMLDPKKLATGAWVGYARRWQYGPVGLSLEAWLEGNVIVNWSPLHFHGDLWLHGLAEVKAFGFGVGLSVDARFEADVFQPFHLLAQFAVSISLPRPLKSRSVDVTLEWGPEKTWPAIPSPFKEVAMEHFKVTTSWPLAPHQGLGPPVSTAPVVPLDGRPHVSFRRPVHDDALVGINPQPVQPEFERIGDPAADQGPAKVRYGLREVELLKWHPQTQTWRTVAVAGRPPATGERTLYGSWAPVPGMGQTALANDKLWLWSRTPFDYTRHGGSEGDDWFLDNFPAYPCVPRDIPDREVCCDFERLDPADGVRSPWLSPEHPEIAVAWGSREPRRVTPLDPPVDGFTRALCLPLPTAPHPAALPMAARPPSAGGLTILLSEPARRVRVSFVAKKKPAPVCLDFRTRARQQNVPLPLMEQGVSIGLPGLTATIATADTTLGDLAGLNCGTVSRPGGPPIPVDITLPCAAATVELVLSSHASSQGFVPATVTAFNAAGAQVAARRAQNPSRQPEMIRFEGMEVKRLRISVGVGTVFLHQLCVSCPDTSPRVAAFAFDRKGRLVGGGESGSGVIEVAGESLTEVRLSGAGEVCLLRVCAVFGPGADEVARRAEMAKHLKSEVARWQQEGEVLEPFSDYRLRIVTLAHAVGEGGLSGTQDFPETNFADFRTEGPPGLAALTVPAGQELDKFDSGLDDLTRYVRQTTPPTVPGPGQKPTMAKPFYRAFDVGVDFDEDYVDLMYRMSGRDLGLYLYDSNNCPVRDAQGRLLAQSGEWGAVEELVLTEGEERWLALAGGANGCLPQIDRSTIARQKKLASAVAGRVLAPDTVYEARLIPLLLREGFRGYAVGDAAQGSGGQLGRWRVRDAGDTGGPSRWEVSETAAPAARYLAQTSGIADSGATVADPALPGTVLVYGGDPSLPPGHAEQPAGWTDLRLGAYVRTDGGGAVGLVFRYQDDGSHYRVSLHCGAGLRRLVRVAGGLHTLLAEDAFTCEPGQDVLLSVEAVGTALRVYQDGAPVFDVVDAAHAQGTVGLYAYDNPDARFSDVRVDDFRRTARPVYRFQFTTSNFTNFSHHLHSYQDETWRAAVASTDVAGALPALAKAVPPATLPGEDEARAYAVLADAVLGPAARRNPPEVQVTRVEVDGAPLAFLLQSPEPIDWLRTDIALLRTPFVRTEPALPGKVKLTGVRFAANRTRLDSVDVLLRDPVDMAGYRIESRLAAWPLSPDSGVVVDAQALAQNAGAAQAWAPYGAFDSAGILPAGTVLQLPPGHPSAPVPASAVPAPLTGVDAGTLAPAHRIFFSLEVRIIGPDGTLVHSRHFLPDADYVAEDVTVLRKADGTGFFMLMRAPGSGTTPFPLAQYRLKLTYHRDNRARVAGSQLWSQAGNSDPEIAVLDLPLQTQ